MFLLKTFYKKLSNHLNDSASQRTWLELRKAIAVLNWLMISEMQSCSFSTLARQLFDLQILLRFKIIATRMIEQLKTVMMLKAVLLFPFKKVNCSSRLLSGLRLSPVSMKKRTRGRLNVWNLKWQLSGLRAGATSFPLSNIATRQLEN